MRWMPRSFWIGVLLVIAAAGVDAATVRGQIARNAGYPAPYMKVTLRGPKGESSPVYTGNDGIYYFRKVPVGDYILEIWNQKGRPTSYKIQVREPLTQVPVITIP